MRFYVYKTLKIHYNLNFFYFRSSVVVFLTLFVYLLTCISLYFTKKNKIKVQTIFLTSSFWVKVDVYIGNLNMILIVWFIYSGITKRMVTVLSVLSMINSNRSDQWQSAGNEVYSKIINLRYTSSQKCV